MDFMDDVVQVELERVPDVAVFERDDSGEFRRLADSEIAKRNELADKYESLQTPLEREQYLTELPLEHCRLLLNELISRACMKRFNELIFHYK